MSARIIAFPVGAADAHRLARRIRTEGFWSLPVNIWNGAADLVEVFAEYPPTAAQIAWLRAANRHFLGTI
jgi:hypothetical protein